MTIKATTLHVALAVGGLLFANPAWAGGGAPNCATMPDRLQLVCDSGACLRVGSRELCESLLGKSSYAAGKTTSPVQDKRTRSSAEQRAQRRLSQLIATID